MKIALRFWMCLAGLVCLLAGSATWADGLIIIHNPPGPTPGHFSFAPLEVSYHRVSVEIRDQVAITSVDQEFINPNPQQLEGTYMFPLPQGAHIDKFSMDINGKQMEAELLPADKARAIYEDIVRRQKDPALLEYVGRDAFKVRVFPIEGNGKKQIKIQYTQLLKSDTGLVEYVYPLNTEKFSSRPLKDVSVKVTLASEQAIKSVYCPSHNVEIKRDGARRAVIGYEEKNVRPDHDFKLVFSRDKSDVGINLMTFRNAPDDGYFLLLASPGMEVKQEKVQPKDICIVFDTSGSMAGKKMDQARKALAFCLANLNEQDRFEIVRFSTESDQFFEGLRPAVKENIDKAQAYVQGLKPIGGTAIDEALQRAMKLESGRDQREQRPFVVIFLTDGQPTIGETRGDTIVTNLQKSNPQHVRIFSFGIGTDVNTHLLDRIAEGTRSFSQYVLAEEDIEIKLSNFYTKIKDPVLSNVELAFSGEGIKATQIYPGAMPDLFKGEMLVVFGRYSGKGAGAVKITGTINGEKKTFAADVNFTDSDTRNAFIPRLWATRRVGWLLDEIRRNGETAETKNEVVRLAREHGIVTPYTAYLILEDEQRRNVPHAVRTLRELESDTRALAAAKSVYDRAALESKDEKARSGDLAVANSSNVAQLRKGDNLQQAGQSFALDKGGSFGVTTAGAAGSAPAPAARGANDSIQLYRDNSGGLSMRDKEGMDAAESAGKRARGYRDNDNYASQARVINGRAFYQNGSTWTDGSAALRQDLKKRSVAFNSEEYFTLLKNNPQIAGWLALGNEVDLVVGEELISVR